ncbi:MAG: hypothetical protein ACYCWW_00170 [Deltaproteobacteria bacterium]
MMIRYGRDPMTIRPSREIRTPFEPSSSAYLRKRLCRCGNSLALILDVRTLAMMGAHGDGPFEVALQLEGPTLVVHVLPDKKEKKDQ